MNLQRKDVSVEIYIMPTYRYFGLINTKDVASVKRIKTSKRQITAVHQKHRPGRKGKNKNKNDRWILKQDENQHIITFVARQTEVKVGKSIA